MTIMRKKPKMILFDYGHTLLYENKHDTRRGNQAIWRYVLSNPKQISFEEFDRTMRETWERLSGFRTGMDMNEDDFLRLVLDYLNIGLSVSLEEAEQLIWRGISEGKIMPHPAGRGTKDNKKRTAAENKNLRCTEALHFDEPEKLFEHCS